MPGSIGFQSWIVILDNNSQLAPSQVQLGQVWAQVHPGQIPFCQKKEFKIIQGTLDVLTSIFPQLLQHINFTTHSTRSSLAISAFKNAQN